MWSPAAAAYLAARVEHVDAGDATLAVRRFGAGPSLLLVHGFPLHGFTWRYLLPTLAASFTCIVVDLAGLGDSQWTRATDFSFGGHARRLQNIMTTVGASSYGVVAQDTGATVARCLALLDRDHVRSLVLFNTEIPGHRPPWIREYQYLMLLPGSALIFRQLLRAHAFVRSGMGFGGCFGDLNKIDDEFAAHFVAPYIASAERTDGLRRYLLGIDWTVIDGLKQRHAEIRQPTLFIWGADDPTFPLPLAQAMAPQLPACRGVTAIPDTKLLVYEEAPDAVCRAMLPFLRETAA